MNDNRSWLGREDFSGLDVDIDLWVGLLAMAVVGGGVGYLIWDDIKNKSDKEAATPALIQKCDVAQGHSAPICIRKKGINCPCKEQGTLDRTQ